MGGGINICLYYSPFHYFCVNRQLPHFPHPYPTDSEDKNFVFVFGKKQQREVTLLDRRYSSTRDTTTED